MGGTIELCSELGKGSCFSVELDLPICARPTTAQVEGLPHLLGAFTEARKLSVLVAEDNPFNRHTLGAQVESMGHKVAITQDGQEAFETWLRTHFDVVITDRQMPRMSGFELAKRIRWEEAQEKRQRCRILGLTASAEAEAVGQCLAAGMDEVLFKPVTLGELKRALSVEKSQDGPNDTASR